LIAVPREFEESFGAMIQYTHVSAAILMESSSAIVRYLAARAIHLDDAQSK
jgi:hypothetical protein